MKRVTLLSLGFCCLAYLVASAQPPLKVTQGGFSADVVPLQGEVPAASFYDYQALQSQAGLAPAGHSVLFFYRQTPSQALSLVVIHGPPALDVTDSTGLVRFLLSDLPPTSTLALLDDPEDAAEFAPPVARLRWKWHTGRTDGLVLGELGDDFSIRLDPHFIQGVTEWDLLSATPTGPQLVPLPALDRPLRLAGGAAAGRGVRAVYAVQAASQVLRTFSPLTFDARASLAPEGSLIARYEWDFDGDGRFELATLEPVVSHLFERGGSRPVTLRVTAADGSQASTTRTLALVATQAVRVSRRISTPTALPEGTFRVTLTLSFERDVQGLGLEERWPTGWTVRGVQADGAVLKAASRQWVFPAALKAGQSKTLVYDVTVPAAQRLGGLPRRFFVTGTVTSDLPRFYSAVEGEPAVQVASCLSTPVALAHLDLERNALDLRLSEAISASQWQHARNLWLAGQGLPGSCATQVSLEALQRIKRYRELGLGVDQPLPDGGLRPAVRVVRTLRTSLPAHQLYLPAPEDHRLRVELKVTALRFAASVGLSEFLPFGWAVLPQREPDVLYNAREVQWLLLSPLEAGQTRTLIYDVALPAGETAATFLFRGLAQVPDSPFAEVVEGEQRVETTSCLSTLVAVAHWNLETNEVDVSLDNLIQPAQAQAALALWLDDLEVPGTCGAHLDFDAAQLIVDYALNGVPVDQPL